MPTISVIVPVYKVEKYIHRCVDSILEQTFTDFELILVDDGSPDNCGAICDEYAAKDSRVVVIHQENGGLSAARNAGLAVAKGMYIAFVDSDDCIYRDMLEVLLQELLTSGADFIKSNFVIFTGEQPPEQEEKDYLMRAYTPMEALCDFMETEYDAQKPMKSTACDALYKRELFFSKDDEPLVFPVGKINEDTYIFPELIFRARKIAHINAALYCYFNRLDSIVHEHVSERALNSCDLWGHIHQVLSQYTTIYRSQCANRSAARHLDMLRQIYGGPWERKYFHRVRTELFSDVWGLLPFIDDPRIRITLVLIRCYPIYRLAKRLLRDRIY